MITVALSDVLISQSVTMRKCEDSAENYNVKQKVGTNLQIIINLHYPYKQSYSIQTAKTLNVDIRQ